MSEYSLDDMLSDKELPEIEESTEETAITPETTGEEEATPAAEETPAAEDVEAKDDSTPESDASKEPEPEESWTKQAVLDERRKRQERDARIAELEGKLAERDQPEQKPDWYDDPEKASQNLEAKFAQKLNEQKFTLTAQVMQTIHPDYKEMEDKFVELAQSNPLFIEQMNAAENPALFAYETAKKAVQADELKDIDTYKAKVEAQVKGELEARLRKELEEKYQKQAQKDAAISPSLASASAKGGLTSSDYSGPTPLEDILNAKP